MKKNKKKNNYLKRSHKKRERNSRRKKTLRKTNNPIILNPAFKKVWDNVDKDWYLKCKGITLMSFDDFPVLSRQLGYDISSDDIFTSGLEFVSAESIPGSNNDQTKLNHKNFYVISKGTSGNKIRLRFRYQDPPDGIGETLRSIYMSLVEQYINNASNLNVVKNPYGIKTTEMALIEDGFQTRPITAESFYFETEVEADTYGDALQEADQIIHAIERWVNQQIQNIYGSNQP